MSTPKRGNTHVEAIAKHKYLCDNTIYWADCYGQTYCSDSNKCQKIHPHQYCETCSAYICGCCFDMSFQDKCPKCKSDENLRDVPMSEIFAERIKGLYP